MKIKEANGLARRGSQHKLLLDKQSFSYYDVIHKTKGLE